MGVILFDIDGTLFNPQKFGALYRAQLIEKLKIDEDKLASAIADYYSTLEASTDFDPNAFISYIARRFNASGEDIKSIFWDPLLFSESRFEDAKDALERLSKTNTLGVFSEGIRGYQEYKLKHTGLAKYFDINLIFIYRRKVAQDAFSEIPKEATVVEDKHDVATFLSKVTKTIWLNRKTEDKDPEVATIHSLSELLF